MKVLNLITITASAFLILIVGCKKDTFVENIGLCPVVVTTDPADSALNVSLNKMIDITFNQKIDPQTITPQSIAVYGQNKLEGALSYDAESFTVSFIPSSPLLSNTTYSGKVLTTIKDLNGNALQQDYAWTFSTSNILAPMVTFTDPEDEEIDVVLNKVVTAKFSVPMDASTINDQTFTLVVGTANVVGTVSYTDTTASFTSTIEFLPNTTYTATIHSEASNLAGTNLQNDYVWEFTTGSILAPPTVVSTDPEDLDTNVALDKTITATFSEEMDPATINATSFTLMQGTTPISGVVTYTGNTASFNPNTDLDEGLNYTATITTVAATPSGTTLENDEEWTFRTIESIVLPAVDLGTAERFGILAGVGVTNQAGMSEIHNLDVGISPGVRSSVTGFPPAIIVNGEIYASDDLLPVGTPAMLIQAKNDLQAAYLFAEGATNPAPSSVSGDIGGVTLAPGIYKTNSTLLIQSGNLTLDAQGDPNASWIFQIASGFTTVGGAGGSVILIGGAQAKNVFWQVGSSATIGDNTTFKGNILALTSVTMNSGSTAEGRMLCQNGSVVMTNANTINRP
ncbi:MAG: ice-binding family protein [Salibacteraceae bacterium]